MRGCALCWPPDPDAAWSARTRLSRSELIDSSHFGALLLQCAECGQRFISIFSEQVDWVDGEDPQYWTVMPVTAAEAEALGGKGEEDLIPFVAMVGGGRRALHRDYPKGGEPRTFWQDGLRVI